MAGTHLPCAIGTGGLPTLLVIIVAMTAGCRGVAGPAVPTPGKQVLAITHVTLIDPLYGARPDVTIVIERGELGGGAEGKVPRGIESARIVDVGPSAEVAIPAGATVHDGSGRFAVPGFWDAHLHVSQIGVDAARLLIANGVTSVRDMGSALADIASWRQLRCAGGLVPRVYSPGPKLDGAGDEGFDNWIVSTPEDARRAVDRLKAIGADFIKIHSGLSRPVYDALAAESQKVGLAFAGHIGRDYSALVVAAAGQRTIEHGRGMLPCSPSARAQLGSDPALAWLVSMCAPESPAEPILPALARAGTWFTPTLASWRGHALDRAAAANLDGRRYVPRALEQWWGPPGAVPGPVELELLSGFGPLTASAHRAGVRLLVGTDTGDPNVVPGFALHDELRLFVDAGVPPLAAIRAATLEPARALGVADRVGSIEKNKAADIVLLGADPLADIRNTRNIVAVVLDGRFITAAQLAALIEPLRHD